MLIDAVLASVNGKPITLQDVCSQLAPPRRLTLQEAAMDLEARRVLDALITQSLIEAEAEQRKLKVSDDELNFYIDEVARRNKLSRAGFEEALKGQGLDPAAYRDQVRVEILKSKLAGQVANSGIGVTKEEVDEYLRQHPQLSKSGAKTKLRRILVSFNFRSPEEAHARIEEIRQALMAGGDFGDLARSYSDGAEASEGGSLGVVAEEDLNPGFFDAVFAAKEGEMTRVVEAPDGLHLFYVEKRYVEKEAHNEELYQEVKKILERQKADMLVQNFFSSELMKSHAVDKKI